MSVCCRVYETYCIYMLLFCKLLQFNVLRSCRIVHVFGINVFLATDTKCAFMGIQYIVSFPVFDEAGLGYSRTLSVFMQFSLLKLFDSNAQLYSVRVFFT